MDELKWRSLNAKYPDSAHYSIFSGEHANGMALLRMLFPKPVADELNLVLFSTSGVHGHYGTIEMCEKGLGLPDEHPDKLADVTFLVIHPRIVSLRFGNCRPETQEDIDYLKALRASSHAVLAGIGRHG